MAARLMRQQPNLVLQAEKGGGGGGGGGGGRGGGLRTHARRRGEGDDKWT